MGGLVWKRDGANSLTSHVGHGVVDGVRTVEVLPQASSKAQIAALLDLLDLHLSNADAGGSVAADRVLLRIPEPADEALGALGTLIDAMTSGPSVSVVLGGPDLWAPAELGWDHGDVSEYVRWPELLRAPRLVPLFVTNIIEGVDLAHVRAYPQLSTKAGWSIRVEGLEVAVINSRGAKLKVGRDGKVRADGTRGRSIQRKAWVEATGMVDPVVTKDAAETSNLITKFAARWLELGAGSADQNEHALESRILRGETPVEVKPGQSLDLIQPGSSVVNWGSQFPTKWGRSGDPRYLDALMRDGSTPWAIEMKVEGSGGVGQYYRHAVAQAVLYREFIRKAEPLHFWFAHQHLSAPACESAVVVPTIAGKQGKWRERVARLCALFDVAFVEVDPIHAKKH